jgi:hypothetical protein
MNTDNKNTMTKEQKIDKIVKDLPIKEMRNKMTDAEWHGWFLECWNEAINFTHCCKSDSEQLVCDDNELDCPYEFTSRCTMGRCDCKPKAN